MKWIKTHGKPVGMALLVLLLILSWISHKTLQNPDWLGLAEIVIGAGIALLGLFLAFKHILPVVKATLLAYSTLRVRSRMLRLTEEKIGVALKLEGAVLGRVDRLQSEL